MLNTAQETALATALRAETDAGVVAALAIRNDVALHEWCNAPGDTDAWHDAMSKRDLFEATDVTKFDNITQAPKRDVWLMMMDNAPIDMSRNKMRKAAEDVWGATDSVGVLQACTRKATHAEDYLGGTSATTNTVTAIKLNAPGLLSVADVSFALNRNP